MFLDPLFAAICCFPESESIIFNPLVLISPGLARERRGRFAVKPGQNDRVNLALETEP